MKLNKKLKKKIDNYFKNISSEELYFKLNNSNNTKMKDQEKNYKVGENFFGMNMPKDFSGVPERNIKDPIIQSVVDKFVERSNSGIKKYGTTLSENNVDDFLTHLQEELMDAVNYIEKLKSKKSNKLNNK